MNKWETENEKTKLKPEEKDILMKISRWNCWWERNMLKTS